MAKILKTYRNGGVIAYPTESFYGLGVDPLSEEAIKGLFRLKGRPTNKPIPVIIGDMSMLEDTLTEEPGSLARRIMEQYWPGPLTIILKAKKGLPSQLTAGSGSIAVRIPGRPVTRGLVAAIGAPLTTTSANPAAATPATTPEMITDYFGADIDIIIDAGTLPGGLPSTIIDLRTDKPILIREGQIPFSEIK
jgi:L-threonylcarbamoyladenylate synthase